MMTPGEILDGLTAIANDAYSVAVLWHIVIGGALVALTRGWRPSALEAGAALSLPVICVSVLAWIYGNPFNGTMFALLAVALLTAALWSPRALVARGPAWAFAAGLAMIAFGGFYPHFLIDRPALSYVVAAPVGLLPCPTLSLLIGFLLLGDGIATPRVSLLIAAVGVLYALMGVMVLGVTLDVGLLAGALLLAFRLGAPLAARPPHEDHP